MRRNSFIVIGSVALALAVWWRWPSRDRSSSTGSASGAPVSAARATAAPSSDPPGGTPGDPLARSGEVQKVRRLTSEERHELGALIAAARQRAHATGNAAAGATATEDDVIPLEQVAGPLKDALTAAISILAECYQHEPASGALRTAAALMTMTSDPELGTVIDTGAIKDADGRPLSAKLDQCLRDTIDSLALPPLGAGGKLPLKYTFKFD